MCSEVILTERSQKEDEYIAVCGLDCRSCDIRKVPEDAGAARRVIAWFKKEEWLRESEGIDEVLERGMYCRGCRDDRTIHWSPDCWILQCCADKRGHRFCYECEVFPCENLEKWAQQSEEYVGALNRLKKMKADTE